MGNFDPEKLAQAKVRKHEGWRSTIYNDTKGNPTVGTGYNLNDPVTATLVPPEVRQGQRPLSKEEDDVIFSQRFKMAEDDARRWLGPTYDNLDEERKSVVVNMSYNMGLPTLSGFKKMKDALLQGDYDAAAREMKDSKWYQQTKDRAKELIRIMEKTKGALDLSALNPFKVDAAHAGGGFDPNKLAQVKQTFDPNKVSTAKAGFDPAKLQSAKKTFLDLAGIVAAPIFPTAPFANKKVQQAAGAAAKAVFPLSWIDAAISGPAVKIQERAPVPEVAKALWDNVVQHGVDAVRGIAQVSGLQKEEQEIMDKAKNLGDVWGNLYEAIMTTDHPLANKLLGPPLKNGKAPEWYKLGAGLAQIVGLSPLSPEFKKVIKELGKGAAKGAVKTVEAVSNVPKEMQAAYAEVMQNRALAKDFIGKYGKHNYNALKMLEKELLAETGVSAKPEYVAKMYGAERPAGIVQQVQKPGGRIDLSKETISPEHAMIKAGVPAKKAVESAQKMVQPAADLKSIPPIKETLFKTHQTPRNMDAGQVAEEMAIAKKEINQRIDEAVAQGMSHSEATRLQLQSPMSERLKALQARRAELVKAAPQTGGEGIDPLIKEAKKYESAKEFISANSQKHLMDLSNPEKHWLGRAIPAYPDEPFTDIPQIIKNKDRPGSYLSTMKYSNPVEYKAISSPGDMITIYRAVPENIGDEIRVGDYVALDKRYAQMHLDSVIEGEQKEKGKIISKKVPKKDIVWGEADFTEWAYSPKELRDKHKSLTDIWNKAHAPKDAVPPAPQTGTKTEQAVNKILGWDEKPPEPPVAEAAQVETVSGQTRLSPESRIFALEKERADLARRTTLEGKPIPVEEYKRIEAEIEKEANALGIAMRTTPDGRKVPAIRKQSGVFAEKEFEEFNFKDAGGKTDNLTSWAAAADNIIEGEGFGPMYSKIAAPAYSTIADRNDFISIYTSKITNLAARKGLIKGAWGVLDAKDGEIIFRLLEGKSHPKARVEHKEFVKEMRKIYDELREAANAVRRKLGKEEIAYLENYASNIQRTSLFQDIIKEMQTTIIDNFDFIIPNEKVNPFAKHRIGNMQDKETNFWKIIDGYVQAIAADIFISPLVEKLKVVGSVLEGRGMYKSKKFIDSYIRTNLIKKPDTLDNYAAMGQGSKIRKIVGKAINARQLGALMANLEWIFFTQPMSMGNTVMKAGIPGTIKGALKWFAPNRRNKIRGYTVMRLKQKSGVISSGMGDVAELAAKVYQGRADKFNHYLSWLGDVMEYNLTGMSVSAGIEKGKQYGLKGEQLRLYADYMGQVTQSVYNSEARMQLLNSMAVRAAFPFQSFAGEMFRHLRTLVGAGGGLPLNIMQRLGHVINLIIGVLLINALNEKARGRQLMTVGSFIPLAGGVVDENLDKIYAVAMKKLDIPHKTRQRKGVGMSPVAPLEDVGKLVKAASDVIEHGHFARFRRELLFWAMGLNGIGGAAQANKFIDGLIALEKGYVDDVRGRRLFKVESWSALWRGPWATPEGKKYRARD